jgi:hypothetical protein
MYIWLGSVEAEHKVFREPVSRLEEGNWCSCLFQGLVSLVTSSRTMTTIFVHLSQAATGTTSKKDLQFEHIQYP